MSSAASPAKKAKTSDPFVEMYPSLTESVLSLVAKEDMPKEAVAYIRKLCDYTVPGGKMNRGKTVLDALKKLRAGSPISPDEEKKANVLGWCVEWLQAFFLVADDLMDSSVTRRGQPCWYRLEEVGLIAVNDGLLLESLMYIIIKSHFRGEKYYADLLDLFHETTYKTELGQLLDLTSEKNAKKDGGLTFDHFTDDTHRRIVTYKTAFYTFYLPIACALVLNGETREHVFKEAEKISIEMGVYFQIQDDYLDNYGTPEVIGKIGTDIEDFKCGWLAVKCLETATEQQKAVFKANYGQKDEAKVKIIKALYNDLGLDKLFFKYEDEAAIKIRAMIDAVKDVNKDIYNDLFAKIFKRKH